MSGGLIKDYVHDERSLWLYYRNAFTYNIEGWMRKVYICFFIGSKNGLKPDFTIKLKSTLGLMVDIKICQISYLVKYHQNQKQTLQYIHLTETLYFRHTEISMIYHIILGWQELIVEDKAPLYSLLDAPGSDTRACESNKKPGLNILNHLSKIIHAKFYIFRTNLSGMLKEVYRLPLKL